ncbi:hypothetical protein MADA3029_p0123 [Vibrio nigripulchritudo MADA3029]|uniref:hypothetical protein n=1 Tax=Vibrio nigripulchritudo TaxID=28173 RepID=UPI0003B17EA5|nr:hypothetical protein [Vibrio nigripulchritudo]CCN38731.1 hypothetical protein VIBNIAM115_p0147 [Vibrio nigripulchritudo AM115]CCN45038.1 hypothetical protein VIBNIFTn2_p0146 [Vibrio nigripulchritudo FTn2]CCN50882.1 hypothetical protein VIBNIMADA3020_p0123 [Vibrio nigripulchritudo MADA3020]CCN56740.1 hypothetical protein VIBNIMADA3021_p0123 [Vibrio nigripulchritudo MADA3021]CCN62597.1 hypothetical protein MADA3029_p0123 [Vibrio nigripulchritudo MADA3029]
MAVYSVSYDLDNPSIKSRLVREVLQTFPSSSQVMETTWWVVSGLPASQVLGKFKPVLDPKDKVFISRIAPNEYVGRLTDKQWEWLKENA